MYGLRDIPTNAYSECSVLPVPAFDNGHFAAEKGAWPVKDLVAMAMVAARVGVTVAVVGVCVVRHCEQV